MLLLDEPEGGFMELISRELPADCEIYDTSDYHYGALNCHREGIRQIVAEVAAKRNRFLINKGDSIDAVLPNDKRYASCAMDYQDMLLTPEQQADAIVQDFLPIRRRILAWGLGNHEYKLINSHDYGRYIARQLQVPYGGVAFKFIAKGGGEVKYKLFCAHGRGKVPAGAKDPIQREANRKAWLKRSLESLAGDCAYMSIGHGHYLITVNPTTQDQLYMNDDGSELHQHYHTVAEQNAEYIPPESRWYTMSGSFLKLFSPPGSGAISYGEMALYPPTEMGCVKLVVRDHRITAVEKVKI
jgi:hypothetical protein